MKKANWNKINRNSKSKRKRFKNFKIVYKTKKMS